MPSNSAQVDDLCEDLQVNEKCCVSHHHLQGLSTTFLSSRIVDALDEWWEWQVVAILSKYRCYDGMYANIHCLRTLVCTLARITSEPLSLLCI